MALTAAGVCIGCGGSSHPHTAPTTTTINTAIVPPAITPAYVNAVFVQLNHVYGNAVRELVATHHVDDQVLADLRAIYADPQYGYELNIFHSGLPGSLASVRKDPGDRRLHVISIIRFLDGCVTVQARADYSKVTVSTADVRSVFLVLVSKPPSNDLSRLNPTPWAISYEMTTPNSDACE